MLISLHSCNVEVDTTSGETKAQTVEITLLQLNDVYEMTAVSSGTRGGLARVQTLLKSLKEENPNTFSVLAGDLYSPSVIGNAEVNGKRLAGQQMVNVLNAMQWDFFTIGNHEFDIPEEDFRERLKESEFKNITDNVSDSVGKPFDNTMPAQIIDVEGVKMGILGITMDNFNQDFATITPPLEAARKAVKQLQEQKADIIIAMTHQSLEDDIALARQVPEINLILGGHEHDNFKLLRNDEQTPITKADANSKSAFVHYLTFNKDSGTLSQRSEIILIDETIEKDIEIERLAKAWEGKAYEYYTAAGYEPDQVVCKVNVTLDGTEASVRSQSTNLTDLLTQGFIDAFPDQAKAGIMNGGSIRLDDKINPKNLSDCPVTQYEIMKISPFGGSVSLVEMRGDILMEALNQGAKNTGKGSFLQYSGISQKDGQWLLQGAPIDNNTRYKIAISSYLVEKGDQGLKFLVYENSRGRVKKVEGAPKPEFNKVAISAFERAFPGS